MHSLTVKNIPDFLYNQLKYQASISHQSLNNEVIILLKEGLSHISSDTAEQTLAKARELRKLTKDFPLSEELLDEAINKGRV